MTRSLSSSVALLAAALCAPAGLASSAGCSKFTEDADTSPDGGGSETGTGSDAATTPSAVLVDKGSGAVSAVTASEAGVAWAVGNLVYGATPTTPAVKMFDAKTPVTELLLAGENVYTSLPDAVVRCAVAKDCGAGDRTPFPDGPAAMAVAGDTLYLAERRNGFDLRSCPAARCGTANVAVVGSAGLGSAATTISVAPPTLIAGYATGLLLRIPLGGGMAKGLDDVPGFKGLVGAGTNAFYLDGSGATLIRRDLNLSMPSTVIAKGLADARDLVRDGVHIYWLEAGKGAVRRCTFPACNGITDVAVIKGAARLAVGDRVYVATAAGEIYAAPKP